MPIRIDLPVIYLTFANEQRGSPNMFLRNLKVEREALRTIFDDAVLDGELETVIDPDVTQTQIFRTFQGARYRDRINIFHYGGHADSDELLMEADIGGNQAFYSSGLAALFGQQAGNLKLVFLNGCGTRAQADLLLAAGVPAVIATSRKIADADATLFSQTFYRGIAGNATIERAFKEAESALLAQHGSLQNFRAVYWDKDEEEQHTDDMPWKLFSKEAASLKWKLHPDEVMGTGRSLVDVKTALIGKTIGSYVITEFLSIGNFGFVFRGKHTTLDKEVAIKISHRILKGYDKLKDIIQTGAKGLGALNHPNIVKTEDMGEFSVDEADKRFYVIMEMVNGTRLDKAPLNIPHLNRQELKFIIDKLLQMLDGLRAAHETVYQDNRGFRILGVLHGNIKPRKIMLAIDNTPKLIDFMIADLTTQNDIELDYPPELADILKAEKTDDFMSPEQSQANVISIAGDIYSMAAVIFVILTGKKLTDVSIQSQEDVERLMSAYNNAIPKYLAGLVYKATQSDPQNRFVSVKAMIDFIMANQSWWTRFLSFFGKRKLD